MPVITSATPAYSRAMKGAGLDSLACRNQEEWIAAIELMISDESLRHDTGNRGRAFAEKYYGEDDLLTRWDKVFDSLGYSFH